MLRGLASLKAELAFRIVEVIAWRNARDPLGDEDLFAARVGRGCNGARLGADQRRGRQHEHGKRGNDSQEQVVKHSGLSLELDWREQDQNSMEESSAFRQAACRGVAHSA